MFKIALIVVVALLAFSSAQQQERFASVLRSDFDSGADGSFKYGYDTSNGIRAEASGYIKNPYARAEDQIQVIQGSYSYYGPDGVLYQVNYIADENGFQPQGAHIPQPGRRI